MRVGRGATIRGVVLTDRSVTVSGHDGLVRTWDTETQKQTSRIFHTAGNVYDCACVAEPGSNTVTRMASGGDDGVLKVWVLDSHSELLHEDRSNPILLQALAVSHDGTKIATGDSAGVTKVWGMQMLDELKSFTDPLLSTVDEVAFSPCGSQVAAGGFGKTQFLLWEMQTGKQLIRSEVEKSSTVACIRFSACGRRVLVGKDKEMQVWDTSTGTLLWSVYTEAEGLHGQEEQTLARGDFDPSGSEIAICGGGDTVAFFSFESGERTRSWNQTRGDANVRDLRYSHDGDKLITCGKPTTVQVWDPESGEELVNLFVPHSGVYPRDPWLSACGTKLLIAGDQSLLLDAVTGKMLHRLDTYGDSRSRACFTPDSSQIVLGLGTGNIRVKGLDNKVHAVACNIHDSIGIVTARAVPGKRIMNLSGDQLNTETKSNRGSKWGRIKCEIENGRAIKITTANGAELGFVDTANHLEAAGFEVGTNRVLAVTQQGAVLQFECCGLV